MTICNGQTGDGSIVTSIGSESVSQDFDGGRQELGMEKLQ